LSVLGFLGMLVSLLAVAATAFVLEARRDERWNHRNHLSWGVSDVTCHFCTEHDWTRWRSGTCKCARCRNIRRLEHDLEIDLGN
jgi:hypothetical protein